MNVSLYKIAYCVAIERVLLECCYSVTCCLLFVAAACKKSPTHTHYILCDTGSFLLDTAVLEYEGEMFIQNITIGEFCYRA